MGGKDVGTGEVPPLECGGGVGIVIGTGVGTDGGGGGNWLVVKVVNCSNSVCIIACKVS